MEPRPSSRHRVLDFLFTQTGAVTRPEVAAACDLSRPTVFSAVRHLEREGLVHETGQRSGSPGRSAALFEISPAAGTVLALDIGGSNLRVAVADVRGRPLAELREPTGDLVARPSSRRQVNWPARRSALRALPHRGCRRSLSRSRAWWAPTAAPCASPRTSTNPTPSTSVRRSPRRWAPRWSSRTTSTSLLSRALAWRRSRAPHFVIVAVGAASGPGWSTTAG